MWPLESGEPLHIEFYSIFYANDFESKKEKLKWFLKFHIQKRVL